MISHRVWCDRKSCIGECGGLPSEQDYEEIEKLRKQLDELQRRHDANLSEWQVHEQRFIVTREAKLIAERDAVRRLNDKLYLSNATFRKQRDDARAQLQMAREALRRILNSEVVTMSTFASYSEAIADGHDVLAKLDEVK